MSGWQVVAVIAMVFITIWLVIGVGMYMNLLRTEQQQIAMETKRIEADIHISDNETKVALTPRDFFGRALPLPRADQGTDMPLPERERVRG